MANSFKYTHIATALTTVVRSTPGSLHTVCINAKGAGTVTLYDHASLASGNIIAIIGANAAEGHYQYDVDFALGLVVVTSGTTDVTITTGRQG